MKTILFLVRKDKISIRRYALVARQLKKLNIDTCFLNFADCNGIIKETIEELCLSDFSECRVYNLELPDMLHLAIARIKKHIVRKFRGNSMDNVPIDSQQIVSVQDNFENLLRQLNFNTAAIVKQYYNATIDWWETFVAIARNKIRKIKPDCIIYDLEMPSVVRAFLFAAKEEKIPIFSMQHGAGFAEQYSNFPRLADYYIAYSPYCAEIIKKLPVEDENIFLTGVPDTDLVYDYDPVRIREELESRYNLNFDRKIILVALRPTKAGFLNDANDSLISTIGKVLGDDEKFDILIKPHNKDHIVDIPFSNKKIKYKNFKIIDRDYSFLKLLKISHYMITHMSSCVVEATLMRIPTIVLEFDTGVSWPEWETYKTYHKISPIQLERILTEIKSDKYVFEINKDDRKKFVERFRYKYDNKSAERIAMAIEHIIHTRRIAE